MWFDSWSDIVRVLLVGIASYAFLIVSIRVSGKRTLAQLNAFDFIVTVALGSTLATILLTSDVAFVEGIVALSLLLLLQAVVAFAAAVSRRIRKLTTSAPTLVLWDGQMDEAALLRQRIARADVEQAIRQSGTGDLGTVAAVVLESNGKLSVISREHLGDASALGALRPSLT
ncbi:DUF421 domain-containing protein [Microbacterium schleiferi]|uniref:DUF421 domain-containing protein n=1 Tax=Microbacterium schleiferi TaxID=69362 RepID=A0A7S8MXM3_9MICO|nr:YetF domain-containing protein [Microbacterium schleiferi]QPE05082.1 DUF421 domain-containing protein [Microbacterium schleiferi]